MSVPSYSDIGKTANDLLGKDYPIGSAKLEVNTTTPNGFVRIVYYSQQVLYIDEGELVTC